MTIDDMIDELDAALAATLSADNVSLRDAVVANTPVEEPAP